MSRGWRTTARIGAFAALALLLTGCLKLNMNLLIGSDDTVSGTVQFGISKEVLELTGSTPEDLLGSDAPFPEDAEGVTVTPFDDGEFAGQEFTFENVPLTEFNDPDNPDALTITRSGDTFTVAGVLDLGTGTTGATGATGALGGTAAELFESADIRVTLTFPGDVIDSNGDEVEGNTVTWVPEFGERLEITATASAVDDGDGDEVPGGGGDDGSSLTLILIIVGALVVAAIVVFVIMSQRKKGRTPPGSPMGGDMMGGAPPAGPPVPPASPPVPPAAPPAPPAAPPAPPTPG